MNMGIKRKANRLTKYDYSQNGAYFVAICTKDHAQIFGKIPVGATVPGRPPVELTQLGTMIQDAIEYYNANAKDFIFDHYVIMPNHIHAIIVIMGEAGDRGRSPLQGIVRGLKAYVTKQAGFSPWQKSFNDHIIRNEARYLMITEYIQTNPAKWAKDRYHPGEST